MKEKSFNPFLVLLAVLCWLCAVHADAQLAAPVFQPAGNLAFGTTFNVTISATGSTAIYYTTDGSTPSASSKLYSAPVVVGCSLTLKAIATNGSNWSTVTTAVYAVTGDIGTGASHVLAVKFNGNLYTWGLNNQGQLGIGSFSPADEPIPQEVFVNGSPINVVAVAGGNSHSLVYGNHSIWTFGENNYGQLGNGTTNNSSTPVNIPAGGGNILAIASGANHCLAVEQQPMPGSQSNVYAWGYNADGECGNGNQRTPVTSPTQVEMSNGNALLGISQVAAGDAFSIALSTAGTVWG